MINFITILMPMISNKLLLTKSYVIYNNEKDKAIKVFSEKYAIETKGKSNVLSYPGTLYVKGTSTIWACIDTKPITCNKCRVEDKTKNIYLGKSTV